LVYLFDRKSLSPTSKSFEIFQFLDKGKKFSKLRKFSNHKTPDEHKKNFKKVEVLKILSFWENCGKQKYTTYIPDFSGKTFFVFRNLLKKIDQESLMKAIKKYWSSTDSFIVKRHYPLGLFVSNVNLYLNETYNYSESFYKLSPEEDAFYQGTLRELDLGRASMKDLIYVRDKQKYFYGKVQKIVINHLKNE
jgi:hypothetical protein